MEGHFCRAQLPPVTISSTSDTPTTHKYMCLCCLQTIDTSGSASYQPDWQWHDNCLMATGGKHYDKIHPDIECLPDCYRSGASREEANC